MQQTLRWDLLTSYNLTPIIASLSVDLQDDGEEVISKKRMESLEDLLLTLRVQTCLLS